MDYACPVWRSAARSHIKKLQVLQSKCFRIAISVPSYVGNRQIHDNLGVPYFSDHNRSLTERFDSKLADVGNHLVEQLDRMKKLWTDIVVVLVLVELAGRLWYLSNSKVKWQQSGVQVWYVKTKQWGGEVRLKTKKGAADSTCSGDMSSPTPPNFDQHRWVRLWCLLCNSDSCCIVLQLAPFDC
jgi:hypothetical protein